MSDRFGSSPMTADIYVFHHPLHAVTDTSGHYRIDGVPVHPKLTVFARLAVIGETAKEGVEVLAGVVQKVDLTLNYPPPVQDAGTSMPRKDGGTSTPLK
jgi:hypothetical protein